MPVKKKTRRRGMYIDGEIYQVEDIEDVYLDFPGVYALYDEDELIYIGSSTKQTVEIRIKSHLSGREGPCTQQATAFCAEGVYFPDDPEEKEGKLLRRYELRNNCLPRCNDVMP